MKAILFFITLFASIFSHADINYSDVSCEAIREVSYETMSNWQYGYSFKDMLDSTETYGEYTHDKDRTSLKESRQYAYGLAQDAMDKPVREFKAFKDHAAYKFANFNEANCLLWKEGSYPSITFARQLEECSNLADYASGFMKSRQMGIPIGVFLKTNLEEYEKALESEPYRRSEIEETFELTESILQDVYQYPIAENDFEKEKLVIEYEDSYYNECTSI